jgi:hypothetical protein
VIASDCLTADAIATAIMVLGVEKGLPLCCENGWQLSVIQRAGTNGETLETRRTDQFPIVSESQTESASSPSIWPAFIGALVVFSLAIAGMAIGAIFNNRPITGSCGGIAANRNEDGSSACSLCQKPVTACPDANRKTEAV